MKYHKLSAAELEPLEAEFIKFLIVQGLDGSDWNKIKANEPNEAEAVMEQFSDMVIERSLLNIKYLELIMDKAIYTFQCAETEIKLNAMTIDSDSAFSFSKDTSIEHIQGLLANDALRVNVFTQTKSYQPDRNSELYGMLNNQFSISDGVWFTAIEKLI